MGTSENGEDEPPSDSVAAFLQALAVEFPPFEDVPDELLHASPWASEHAVTETSVYCTMDSHRSDAVARVVAIATRFGLCCFDPQSDRILEPGDVSELMDESARRHEFERGVKAALVGECKLLGLRRGRGGVWWFERTDPDIQAALQLYDDHRAIRSRRGEWSMRVDLVLGFWVDPLERRYAELTSTEPDREILTTTAWWPNWDPAIDWVLEFSSTVDHGIVLARFAGTVTEVLLPYIAAMQTPEKVYREVEARRLPLNNHRYYEPLMFLERGEPLRAQESIAATERSDAEQDWSDPPFHDYARRLMEEDR